MKAKYKCYEGDLIQLEEIDKILCSDGTIKRFYFMCIQIDKYTTVKFNGIPESDIFIENKKEN